jgi:hypothetical protein
MNMIQFTHNVAFLNMQVSRNYRYETAGLVFSESEQRAQRATS